MNVANVANVGRRAVLLSAAAWLSGCAIAPRVPDDPALPRWSGRLAVQVDAEPRQSVSAAFDLRGSAERGELSLLTPIGSTAALLRWSPGHAQLREEGGATQEFPSLEALIDRVLGTSVPVAALFDWLRGTATSVAGWQADLSRHAQGRVVARRDAPGPAAVLRIVLDDPR